MKRIYLTALALLFIVCAVPAAQAQLLMRGDASYWVRGDRIRINIEDITNFSDETSGRLALMVWASEDPWETFDHGQLIAYSLLPKLLPNQNLSDVRRTMAFHKPRTGWYYITVTLQERVRTESGTLRWVIRDKIEFNEQQFFRRFSDSWYLPF